MCRQAEMAFGWFMSADPSGVLSVFLSAFPILDFFPYFCHCDEAQRADVAISTFFR
jgi:hypothetical protein